MLKAQIESKDESARTEIRLLRETNARLEGEKTTLEGSVNRLKDKTVALEAEIAGLTEDVREQKTLPIGTANSEYGDAESLAKKYKKLRKMVKDSERRNLTLAEEPDDLSSKILQLEAERVASLVWEQTATRYQAEAFEKDDLIEKLQCQVARLEQGFRQRGGHLILLSRDSGSKVKIRMEKNAAVEAKSLLQTHVSGMYIRYRTLLENNNALMDKLTSMAVAGGFGHRGSIYRRELEMLKGQPLEELYEYKQKV
jgi:predicted nuclease with TOPRIM domain